MQDSPGSSLSKPYPRLGDQSATITLVACMLFAETEELIREGNQFEALASLARLRAMMLATCSALQDVVGEIATGTIGLIALTMASRESKRGPAFIVSQHTISPEDADPISMLEALACGNAIL